MNRKLILAFIICVFIFSSCKTVKTNVSKSSKAAVELKKNAEMPVSAKSKQSTSDIIEIPEKFFITQINEIYVNQKDYLGKTIKYEGIFDTYYWEEMDQTYHYVIRYGPGCCGNDANAGFEVAWDGEYPEQNDWVEAVGVLEAYEEDGTEYLRLKLSSLNILPERGLETVTM